MIIDEKRKAGSGAGACKTVRKNGTGTAEPRIRQGGSDRSISANGWRIPGTAGQKHPAVSPCRRWLLFRDLIYYIEGKGGATKLRLPGRINGRMRQDGCVKSKNSVAVLYAILAAVCYALNTPFSKLLLEHVPATFMAAFLYLGAGLGVGVMYVFHFRKESRVERLEKKDFPYTLGMILLDILAPIFLMIGIRIGSSSNASLLGNFEIAATALIALLIFHEPVSKKLWTAIGLITVSSMILSFERRGSLAFSVGSLFVLLAAVCWGFENNCTRSISEKSTYQIVTLKGLCSGAGSFIIALIAGEKLPEGKYILCAMLLGFVAYGLSIFTYIRAQRGLGAAKTSAYYAIAPFIGTALAFAVHHEPLTAAYLIALVLMIAGSVFTVWDTLVRSHFHSHVHLITHTHDGSTHTHAIVHEHQHTHFADSDRNDHHHNPKDRVSAHEINPHRA